MSNENPNQTMENTHDHHQAQLDQEWLKTQSNSYLKRLQAGESAAVILEDGAEFLEAFKPQGKILDILKCSDGRVGDDPQNPEDEKLGVAGECILMTESELEAFVEKNKGRIKAVTSHEGCGAADLRFKQLKEKGEALPEGVTTSDELGISFAKALAGKLGAEYYHIGHEKFDCDVHNERLLILDGTARFNANKVPNFPPRFSSAALGLDSGSRYVEEEARVLSSIALSNHGFGQRFTAENPFYILIISSSPEQLKQTKELLLPLAEQEQGKIKIMDILLPTESN